MTWTIELHIDDLVIFGQSEVYSQWAFLLRGLNLHLLLDLYVRIGTLEDSLQDILVKRGIGKRLLIGEGILQLSEMLVELALVDQAVLVQQFSLNKSFMESFEIVDFQHCSQVFLRKE